MELFSAAELENLILSVFYRTRHQGADRRSTSIVPVHHDSGLPESAADLLPYSNAVVGTELALRITCDPDWWATCFTGLHNTPKSQWTAEDVWGQSETKMRCKLAIKRMAEKGWFDEQPQDPYTEKQQALAGDGFTIAAKITWKGLEAAEAIIPKHPKLMRGPVSVLAGLTPSQRANAPDWAQKAFKERG